MELWRVSKKEEVEDLFFKCEINKGNLQYLSKCTVQRTSFTLV